MSYYTILSWESGRQKMENPACFAICYEIEHGTYFNVDDF